MTRHTTSFKKIHAGTLIFLILVVCLVIDHFKKINVPAWIQYCAVFVWLQLLNAVAVAMFLIPVIAAVPAFLYQIILKIMQIL